VDDVLEKLDLTALKDEVLGNDVEGGISPEYRKKVTIGVELVMDPGLLFLDEPTTGKKIQIFIFFKEQDHPHYRGYCSPNPIFTT